MTDNKIMRKCLYLNNSPDPKRGDLAKLGGGGMSLLTLWGALPDRGWDASAVLPADGPMTEATRKMGIPCSIYPYIQPELRRPIRMWRNYLSWRKLVQTFNPEIIHSNAPDPARSIMTAAASLSKRVVCHFRWPPTAEGTHWLFHGLPKPSAFIFNSHAMKSEIWPRLSDQCQNSRAFVVHNAVDLESYKPSPRPGVQPFRVGIIANLMPAKAHEDFLKMASYLVKHGTEAEFWVIGDDTLGLGRREKLQQMAGELEISDKVRFFGHRTDIPRLLEKLHLTVVTSRIEPFGRVLIESMASGRPVVATKVGGIPEVVRDGETGYLVAAGDYAEMGEKVKDLLMDQDRWLRMSQAGVKDVAERFSVERYAKGVTDVYDIVLDR